MAPRPEAVPDVPAVVNSVLNAVSRFLKSKPRRIRRPKFSTSPEGIDSMELPEWRPPPPAPFTTEDKPADAPIDTPVDTPAEPPAVSELIPAGPEKEPWLGREDLQHGEDYHQLVSNPWNYHRKRSFQDAEPLLGAQHPGRESRLMYARDLWLTTFIFLITLFAATAVISVMIRIQKQLRRRLTRYLEGLGEDQRMWSTFCSIMYYPLSFAMWISPICAVYGLGLLLLLAV